jgi:glyoxylase-like metal-dependent hydrolase (beta-lactamase superfamily II)
MTSNTWLRSAAAAFATAVLLTAAHAAAPQLKTSAPGYYRLMLGAIEVTPLNDGTFPMPVGKLLTGVSAQELDTALGRSFLKDPVETSVNGFLINTGSKLVLIDTGGGAFGPTSGNLVSNLKAAGYEPAQVDEIYITHFHGDHVGGLLVAGKRAFPNAVVRASRQEADYWLSMTNRDAAPADRRDGFQHAMDALAPYVAAGKFKPFDGDVELVPGVRAQAAFGHTPGHTVYVVESAGQKLLLWGDLMHVASVQFPDPSVAIRFDSDSPAAVAQRQKIFADAADKGYWVAGAHLPFPAIGHLRAAASGSGYVFVAANFGLTH